MNRENSKAPPAAMRNSRNVLPKISCRKEAITRINKAANNLKDTKHDQ